MNLHPSGDSQSESTLPEDSIHRLVSEPLNDETGDVSTLLLPTRLSRRAPDLDRSPSAGRNIEQLDRCHQP